MTTPWCGNPAGRSGPPVFLDYAAGAPIEPEVISAVAGASMLCGNPHNPGHAAGRAARDATEAARGAVAAAIGAHPEQLLFTSGATESNNLAIFGADLHRGHLVTALTEHASVLEPFSQLAKRGSPVTRLPVDECGRLRIEQVLAALTTDTRLVSLMWVNNELGTLHPVAELAAELNRRGVRFHVDAAQALGRVPVNVSDLPVDFLTLSSRKIGGPAGIGALYVRQPARLRPLLFGGTQQWGARPGTLPTALCVGFGVAAQLAHQRLHECSAQLARTTAQLRTALEAMVGAVRFQTPLTDAAPGILNVAFEGVAADDLLALVGDQLAIAAGSACSTGDGRPSHVLEALPVPPWVRCGALRFSMGLRTTEADIELAVSIVATAVSYLRALTPSSPGVALSTHPPHPPERPCTIR